MKIWEFRWLKKWVNYTIWMNSIRCIFGKKSAIRHFIINRAYFFLWPGFHWLVWKFFMVFTTILTWKTWKPLVVFMKLENQKIESWGIRLLDHRWYSWNAFCRRAAGPWVVFMKPDKKKIETLGLDFAVAACRSALCADRPRLPTLNPTPRLWKFRGKSLTPNSVTEMSKFS